MPLKTRAWIVSGVVLFVVATLLWHFAGRQQKRTGTTEETAIQPIILPLTNGPVANDFAAALGGVSAQLEVITTNELWG
ncbi:MAG TPA: hypothetical protein VGF13_05360, partial [Verrucomicrobiae bacterium]